MQRDIAPTPTNFVALYQLEPSESAALRTAVESALLHNMVSDTLGLSTRQQNFGNLIVTAAIRYDEVQPPEPLRFEVSMLAEQLVLEMAQIGAGLLHPEELEARVIVNEIVALARDDELF